MKAAASMNPVIENTSYQEPSSRQTTPSSRLAWIIWGCAALFYLYEYILRASPGVITNELMRDFGVSSTALGVLVSVYYYAYVPLQIPCGVIVDWLGPRRVITFSAALCTLGSVLFAYSDSLLSAQIARFILGAGSACAYVSCAQVGAKWFSSEKFAVIAGLTMMMGTFGGIFGGYPFAVLSNAVGWRSAMLVAAVVGVVVTLISWFVIRDRPQNQVKQEKDVEIPLLQGLKVIASNPQSWLIGLYGSLMYIPLSAFAELWGVPYLMQIHGIDNELASKANTMVFFGMALGSLLGPMLSNKIQSRKKVMSWSALLTMAMFLLVVYVPELPLNIVFACLFMGGLFCGGQILYFASATEINPSYASGATIGFTNGWVMLSAIVFQPLLGMLLDFAWDGQLAADGVTHVYSSDAYQVAMMAIPIGLTLAWFVLRFVRETHPNHQKALDSLVPAQHAI